MSSPPTDCRFKLIVEHDNKIIKKKITFSGIPQAFEISLLKNNAVNPLLNIMINVINKIQIRKFDMMSAVEVNKIFPQKKEKISLNLSFKSPAKIKAVPILREKSKFMDMLLCILAFCEIGSISAEADMQKIKLDKTGFVFKNKPIIAPAKAQCAMTTPIKDMFNNNSQTPTIPQDIPDKNDIINAL